MDISTLINQTSGVVGLATFALYIVWQQMRVQNRQNEKMMEVIKMDAVANEKVAIAVEGNTEAVRSNTDAVKSLVSIIQTKL